MNKPGSTWILLLSAATVGMFASPCLRAEVLEKSENIAGTVVHYKVILPNHYDSEKAYPGVMAFAGGAQTMAIVEGSIQRNWAEEAERRGYLVVIPAAPDDVLFFLGGERIFPEFLDKLLSDYKIRDNKFHIAGSSNGGISAFHIAASHPQYFLSVTGFPGALPYATEARMRAISKMCIYMHVGELDSGWVERMQEQPS